MGGVMMVLWLFLLLLGVLWFFLPFAVFGMKPKMELMLKEARAANAKFDSILAEQSATRKAIEELNATILRGLRPPAPPAPRPPVPPVPMT